MWYLWKDSGEYMKRSWRSYGMDLPGSQTIYEKNLFTICHVNVYKSKSQNIVPRCKAINIYITRDRCQVHVGSMARSQGVWGTIARWQDIDSRG